MMLVEQLQLSGSVGILNRVHSDFPVYKILERIYSLSRCNESRGITKGFYRYATSL